MRLVSTTIFALTTAVISMPVRAQGPGIQGEPGQFFGSVSITIGMSETEALRRLGQSYSLLKVKGSEGSWLIKSPDDADHVVGSIAVRAARVVVISSTWTPRTDRSGALSEVLLTLLTKLTSGPPLDGWHTSEGCSVSVANSVTVGVGTQARMSEIMCGRQKVTITVSRTEGGPSEAQVQFVTQ